MNIADTGAPAVEGTTAKAHVACNLTFIKMLFGGKGAEPHR